MTRKRGKQLGWLKTVDQEEKNTASLKYIILYYYILKKPTVGSPGLSSFFCPCQEFMAFFKHLPLLSLQQKFAGALLHLSPGRVMKMSHKKKIWKSVPLADSFGFFFFEAPNSFLGPSCPEGVKHKELLGQVCSSKNDVCSYSSSTSLLFYSPSQTWLLLKVCDPCMVFSEPFQAKPRECFQINLNFPLGAR